MKDNDKDLLNNTVLFRHAKWPEDARLDDGSVVAGPSPPVARISTRQSR